MGAFKPLLPFGDKTVIECCIDYLHQGGVEKIVVVVGHRAAEIRQKLSNVTFALNPNPNSEMGASIAAGIRALPASSAATLIALVDHPAVPPAIVETIIETWQQGDLLVFRHCAQ